MELTISLWGSSPLAENGTIHEERRLIWGDSWYFTKLRVWGKSSSAQPPYGGSTYSHSDHIYIFCSCRCTHTVFQQGAEAGAVVELWKKCHRFCAISGRSCFMYMISTIILLRVVYIHIYKPIYIHIYLFHNTQLCKLWWWHMLRFSARFSGGSLSGSLSDSRGVCSWAAAQNRGQSTADTTVLLPEVNQLRQTEFSFSRDLRLLGSNIVANRRPRQAGSGHHSTGPRARGKHPPCGCALLTNIKDLAFPFGHFWFPLFACHFLVV